MRVVLRLRRHINSWAILSFLFVSFMLLPVFLIGYYFFSPSENWELIKSYLLVDLIKNTTILVLATGLTTLVLGTSLAFIVTLYYFPGRQFFKWALILPLAIPPFIGAYTYQGLFSYTGIIQTMLRNVFGLELNQRYFDLMTIEGAIYIFTLFLFPYVYVVTKSFLENQSATLIENARLLGSGSFHLFFQVIIPFSRAAIFGGVLLVMLEVMNDYGVVKFFGIQTFVTSIFQSWFALNDLESAFKIAAILMSVVIMLMILEKIVRGRVRFNASTTKGRPIMGIKVRGLKGWLLFLYCALVFTIAFLIPVLQLVYWLILTYDRILNVEFFALIKNSFISAGIAAMLIVGIGLIIANYHRLYKGIVSQIFSRIIVLGYSMPGAVIAIGIVTVFVAIDHYLLAIFTMLQWDSQIALRTSMIMLISAYVIRFMAVGYNAIESGFEKIGTSYTEAARTLGTRPLRTFFTIDIPMIKGAIVGGFILVFVDILKELPLTMLLQPFNYQSLATRAFRYANDEMIHEAAAPSLLIILISVVCIFVFHKILEQKE